MDTGSRELLEERLGVAVLVRTLQSSHVTGLSVRAEMYSVVVLNAREFHRASHPMLVIDALTDRKNHAAEQRANAFAAELLLPLEGLTQLLGPPLLANMGKRGNLVIVRPGFRDWRATARPPRQGQARFARRLQGAPVTRRAHGGRG